MQLPMLYAVWGLLLSGGKTISPKSKGQWFQNTFSQVCLIKKVGNCELEKSYRKIK